MLIKPSDIAGEVREAQPHQKEATLEKPTAKFWGLFARPGGLQYGCTPHSSLDKISEINQILIETLTTTN